MSQHIAVIGAGWAGAAAAWQLHQQGQHVTVFDAAPIAGGRARRHPSTVLGQTVDNGQHILLGAYSATLGLMQELGLDLDTCFYRFDLDLYSADGRFRFKTAPLPAPLHLVGPLLSTVGTTFKERLTLLTLQRYLRNNQWQVPAGMTVAELLQHTQQPSVLINKLWIPLCIAALNTPVDQACAQLFANVLRDSLGADRQATQMLIPLHDMTSLWVDTALQHADLRLGKTVRCIQPQADHYLVDDERFDRVIVATNAPSATRLLPDLLDSSQLNLEHNPIATVYLQPERAWTNPFPMQMLNDDANGLAAGQWVFNHAAMRGSQLGNSIAVTISDASRLQSHSKDAIIAAVIEQIQTQSPVSLPVITAAEFINDKRATFLATPHIKRPTLDTAWAGLKLAGDWVQNDYPAVLEGAVRSGLAAAHALNT